MNRNISPPPNSFIRNRFLSRSRSPNRVNGFKRISKSRSVSRSPARNRMLRRSPNVRSPISSSRRRPLSRSPKRSMSRSPRKFSSRRSPKRLQRRRSNHTYSRSVSKDYRRNPRRSCSRSKSPPRYRRRIYGDRDHPEPSNCIGVFGLSKRTEERELWEIFERYGRINKIQLVMDKYTRTSQGFGFVYYDDIDSATKAKSEGNGMSIDGKTVRIDYSITQKAHTPTPGVYLGKKSSRRRGRYDDYDDRDSYGKHEYSDRKRPRKSRSRSPYRRSSSRSYGSYAKRNR